MDAKAIRIENIVARYGSSVILDHLSLTVERGTIYGLLGASGCGKTTLLRCIVGRKMVDTGNIWILGGNAGERSCSVVGPRVGYMPQELALVCEFTVEDMLVYFGTICNMKQQDIKTRLEYLTTLLDLPNSKKLLKHCSGGQQRRVSFAAALVHSPELLILDEPTVGVDPILREKIWDHLKDLVAANRTTVIITTHYVEETKGADAVGLMRNGQILAEESPGQLLSTYNKATLEEVFFLLSQRQEDASAKQPNPAHSTSSTSTSELAKNSKGKKSSKGKLSYVSTTNVNRKRMKALFTKNCKQFYRNVGGILFLITFPLLQMWFFANAIGSDPKQLRLGIVNNESMSVRCIGFDWNSSVSHQNYECHFRNLTCRFLTYMEHPMIHKVLYNSFSDAIEGIKHGNVLGVLYVPTNFSSSFEERVFYPTAIDNSVVDYGEIKVYMDMSNKLTGAVMAKKIFKLFIDFQKKLFSDCDLPEKFGSLPFQEYQLFGDESAPLSRFMTPGMILLLVFLLGSTMTSQIIVKEKLDGVWDRSIIAGVTSLEITLSHLSFQCIIMLVEVAEIMIMFLFVPGVNVTYSDVIYWNVFVLTYLVGVCGMAYGFFVSSFCQNPGEANILCTGGFVPMTLICGVVWPIEAMPIVLRWCSLISPCTMAILSFRNLMAKGWSLWDASVISGFAVVSVWIMLFAFASVWIIKIKR
ncbi:ABC transporter G family member 23-like isoform X2 [Euwallacea fornicatus]|uniref:ABC transporter G family member 23-like isoform X2 n=1 Tax=Euwallacea fornicatus TaxID=995702 RepID=UPI003390694D